MPYIENIALFTYTNSDEAPAAKFLAAFAGTESFMFKWQKGIIWLVLFCLFVDGSQSAHCAVLRPSRSIPASDVVVPRDKPKTSTNVSSRSVVRPVRNAISGQTRNVRKPVSARTVVARSATNANIAETKSGTVLMNERGDMLSFCKEQYTKCMDNYCNVLDDKLGRCICSANLKKYTKTEDGLNQATTELQNVVQQIKYIGLTADQVESLFSQTAAELELQSISDNSQLKNSLDEIKAMIVNVQSGRAVKNSVPELSFDTNGILDFSLDKNGFSLINLFDGFGANTNSISNQRGENLYKTAITRCSSSVLDTCQAQGVDISMITNAYDMEIDKACIAYERALGEANNQMLTTIRNANSVLQRARLAVAGQKDIYDMRQCVTELDSCMQDEFVCGSDYENCLDPTGKFIVKGDVVSVVNQDTMMTEFWGVSNPSGDRTFIAQHASDGIIKLLLDKIGNPTKDTGMCNAVLNKCQSQWKSEESDNYVILNQVTLAYLGTIVPQIIKYQNELISDFMGDCKQSVYLCMNNVTSVSNISPRPAQSVINFLNPSINACGATINSCKELLNIDTKELLADWIRQNVCDEYDFDNDVCSVIALMEQNCRNGGNLWIDGSCQDSTGYYTKLVGTYEELPSYCLAGGGDEQDKSDCVDGCHELQQLLQDEPKPQVDDKYGGDNASFMIKPECTNIGWMPIGIRDNSEVFCIVKGCYLNGTSRCISGYTTVFDPCGYGGGSVNDFICCSPDKIDECVQQHCTGQ